MFDESELALFRRRFEEGYDVIKEDDDPVDIRYNVWLSMQCKSMHLVKKYFCFCTTHTFLWSC